MRIVYTPNGGVNLLMDRLMLPDNMSVEAINVRPGRANLQPMREWLQVKTGLLSTTASIYRMGRDTVSQSQYWLQFDRDDVSVARSLVADDSTERIFYNASDYPRWTDNTLALTSEPYPTASRRLGVLKPGSAPTLTIASAGTGNTETRAYVVTWVNSKGEEGQPSAPRLINCNTDATITVARNNTAPGAEWSVTAWRIYRTQSGSNDPTTYFFSGEQVVGTTTFTDTLAVTSGVLETETYDVPPTNLKGLKVLWNGIMAGHTQNTIRFSVPYKPYAWPLEYELTIEDTIVGLAVWQKQLLVMTNGKTYIVTGSEPESMAIDPLDINQACIAKNSIVEFGHGVVYASQDGLYYIGSNGSGVLTQNLLSRRQWEDITVNPSSIVAEQWEGLYLAGYNAGGAQGRNALMIDPLNPVAGIYFNSQGFRNVFRDPLLNSVFVLDDADDRILEWDGKETAFQTAQHMSKTFLVPKPTSFAWAQVDARQYPVTLSVWANDVSRLSNFSVPSAKAFRIPKGSFLTDKWRIQVETTGEVSRVALANSIQELQAL